MNASQAVIDYFSRARRNRYALAALAANVAIWVVVFLAVALFRDGYVSEWSLIIPSSDRDAQVSMADIGQATSTSRSQYDSRSLDPRVNYRAILLSENVMGEAADRSGVAPAEFAKPQVKLIEQSSILTLRTAGDTPGEARKRAQAHYAAFQARLAELRADESLQRDKGIEEAIRTSRQQLDEAQRALVEFKVEAGIVSSKQMEETLSRITGLQQRRFDLRSQVARGRQFVSRLSGSLSLKPAAAGLGVALQSDSLFIQLFQQHATASAELSEFRSKWGANHPQVQSAERRQRAAFDSLLQRASMLTGRDLGERQVQGLTIGTAERSQEPLVRELVSAHAQVSAQKSELKEVERQYSALRGELKGLATEYSRLEDLERRLKFAEAIFNSTLGKIDVGRSNIFSSYPLVQTLVAPTLPERRSVRNVIFAVAGGLACSFFVSVALTLAWLRRKSA